MTDAGRLAFVLGVLAIGESESGLSSLWEDVWWRMDGEFAPVTFLLNCNDLFWWATADAETITPENLPALHQAVADVRAALGVAAEPDILDKDRWEAWWKAPGYASALFVARLRSMRPQRPCYQGWPEALHPLFDACGPPRHPKDEG